jgi:hypothetical protein
MTNIPYEDRFRCIRTDLFLQVTFLSAPRVLYAG